MKWIDGGGIESRKDYDEAKGDFEKSLYSMTTSEINTLSEKDFDSAVDNIRKDENPFELDFTDYMIRREIRERIKEGASPEKAILSVIFDVFVDFR